MTTTRRIAAAILVASAPALPALAAQEVFPLVLCVERTNSTNTRFGSTFPWSNDSAHFASYRNQYLYPSTTLAALQPDVLTIESIHARASSFSGNVNVLYSRPTTQYI